MEGYLGSCELSCLVLHTSSCSITPEVPYYSILLLFTISNTSIIALFCCSDYPLFRILCHVYFSSLPIVYLSKYFVILSVELRSIKTTSTSCKGKVCVQRYPPQIPLVGLHRICYCCCSIILAITTLSCSLIA